jgi:hypothetical protein
MTGTREPYVIALFDWSSGRLQLQMIGQTIDGRIAPRTLMPNPDHAHRWASPQAARQFLKRGHAAHRLDSRLRVLDLRRVHAPLEPIRTS